MADLTDVNSKGSDGSERDSSARARFFPVLDQFLEYVGVPLERFHGPRKVLVSLDFLRSLIGIAAGSVAFDETFYKDRYQDLRKAYEEGEIRSLRAHFICHGFFERRQGSLQQATPIDEKWYLAEYPDVADGILKGVVPSAASHYITTGSKEGRSPAGNLSEDVAALLKAMNPSEPD